MYLSLDYLTRIFTVNWALIALVFAGLCLILRIYWLDILQTTVTWTLGTFNPGVLSKGRQISGPTWRFPNGTVIERFVNGRDNSTNWQKYGPVYRVWSGPHPEIVITTPEDLKHFSSDANDHPKTNNLNLGWYAGQLLGQCMGVLHGQDWKRLRKVFEPPFTHSAALVRIDVVDKAARKYIAELPLQASKTIRTAGEKGQRSFELPVLSAFSKFPYFLTASTIYGPMTGAEERDLWALTERRLALNRYGFAGGPYRVERVARLFDFDAVQRLHDFHRDWREYNARMVKVRREARTPAPIITYWDEYERENMSMIELLQTLDEFLMLNIDVITHVITWLVTLIAGHEHAKEELRDEAIANKDNLLDYLAKTDTHLHRCFVESMRVRPFAIFTMGESSSVVKNFHGVLVKPNTQILVDVLGINVRNPFWGSDSEKFDPSRLRNIKQSELRYNLHSFGIGSRKCMGQYIAGHIVKSLVVHLFNEYEVVLLDSRQSSDSYDVDKSTWTPKSGASLMLTKRIVPGI